MKQVIKKKLTFQVPNPRSLDPGSRQSRHPAPRADPLNCRHSAAQTQVYSVGVSQGCTFQVGRGCWAVGPGAAACLCRRLPHRRRSYRRR